MKPMVLVALTSPVRTTRTFFWSFFSIAMVREKILKHSLMNHEVFLLDFSLRLVDDW